MSEAAFDRSARDYYFEEAKSSLEGAGRYWNAGIPRETAKRLGDLLEAEGLGVKVHEVPPEWEHVFDGNNTPYEELKDIARRRAILRGGGTPEERLPA
jgi:hypothetical protein